MSSEQDPIKFCTFSLETVTDQLYSCYAYENCCDVGCCLKTSQQIYQAWYYWLVFLVVFILISAAGWCCRNPRRTRNSHRSTASYQSPYISAPLSVTRNSRSSCCQSNDFILQHFLVSLQSRHERTNEPPAYNNVVPSVDYAYYEPPPRYSSLAKLAKVEEEPTTSIVAIPNPEIEK